MRKKNRRPNSADIGLGECIRAHRLIAGMSQSDLAGKLGVSFQQVQKYEKGTNRIGASRLQQISTTLNVPPSFFFDGAPSGGTAGAPPEVAEEGSTFVLDFIATTEGLNLNKAFARISDPKVRKRIIDLVGSLAEGEPPAGSGGKQGKS